MYIVSIIYASLSDFIKCVTIKKNIYSVNRIGGVSLSNIEKIEQAKQALKEVIIGKDEAIDLLFVALLAQGHVLLESVPGTGKTKLAKSFARVMDSTFSRVQFTPDVLPSDVTGIRYFNLKTQEFELRMGPVLANILLADEINRATPKTQSSLLEVMEEHQATIDGETVAIDSPFMVIATQNPVENNYGTFPLPEAQLDRFLFKIDLGYPALTEEKKILRTYQSNDPYQDMQPCLQRDTITALQDEVKQVRLSDVVTDYMLQLVHATREHAGIELGISPRGMLALMRACQAKAFLIGRDYVTPEDVKQLAPFVFEHRLILSMEGSMQKTAAALVKEILGIIPVPVEEGATAP